MKILHITAMAPLSPNSGVPAVLKCLTDEQNKIESIEARVLALCSKVDMMNSSFFDSLGDGKISDYLDVFKPDMAIFHSFYHIEYMYATNELVKRNIPFFIEPHGSFGHNAMKKSWLKKYIADRTVFKTQIRDAAGYIFTNEVELKDTVYQPKQSSIIPNGIVKDVVLNSSNKQWNESIEPIFYFLGRYDIHHKGLDYLFDALAVLEKMREPIDIRLYGVGDEKQMAFVEEHIQKFKIVQVQDFGTIYGDKKKLALEQVNILVLTSRYEGSPMTVLDGFSYGNPCLVTPGTNVADEAVKNNLGWKVELNPQSIAEGFIRAKSDYKLHREEYVSKCKTYVLDNYTWERMAELSINEYKRMLENYERSRYCSKNL